MIFYTNRFIPERFAAITVGFVILIRPQYREDVGLHEHEKTHVRQFLHDPLYAFRYTFSKKWRLKYEVEAYVRQLEFVSDRQYYRHRFAEFLRDKYNLDITQPDALAAIDACSRT